MAEDTLPPLKERRRHKHRWLPVRLKPSGLGSQRHNLSFRTEGSIRLLFSAELRPIHLSQSLTFVAQDILPPLKERRRQQAQVVSSQTNILSTWVRTRRFDVQEQKDQLSTLIFSRTPMLSPRQGEPDVVAEDNLVSIDRRDECAKHILGYTPWPVW